MNAPTLDAIADPPVIDEDAGQQAVNLSGISDGEGGAAPGVQEIEITASSDNQLLIPDGGLVVNYTPGDTTGTLDYTPLGDAFGTAVVTVTITDGGTDGVVGTGGDDETFFQTFTVEVDPVNDPPVLTATGSDPTFTEGAAAVGLYSGASVDLVEAGDSVQSIELTVSGLQNGADEILSVDGTDVALTDGVNLTTAANGFDVSVSEAGGTATITLTRVGNFSAAEAESLIDGLTYRNESNDPLGANRVATIASIQDDGGTANSGVDASAPGVTSTVAMTAINDEPTLTATATDPTFTQGDADADLFDTVAVNTVESGQNVQSITLTVSNLQDGADEILVVDGSDVALTDGNNVNTAGNGYTVGVSVAGTTATVTIQGSLTASAAELLVDGLAYRNESIAPQNGSTRVVTLTEIQDDGGTANGGADTAALAVASTVTLAAVNAPPTLTATGDDPTFVEGGAAAELYSAASVGVVEAGQNVQSLSLTVTNLQNGADEVLVVDGSSVALTNGNNVNTAANGFDVAVSVAGSTATVTITRAGNYTAAEAQALVNGLAYRNDNNDPQDGSTRVVTLTEIQDDGGTANSGDDTTALSIASTVTLDAVNDPPTLTATGDDPTFVEGGAAVGLYNTTVVSTVEGGQSIQSLTLTVSNLQNGADEILVVDGTNVALTNGNNVNTAANGFDVAVAVAGGTATVTITRAGNYSTAETSTLVDNLQYQNLNDDPTGASRVVTLTEIQDDGGGIDTGALAVASTVSIQLVNQPPDLTADGTDPTFEEGDAPVALFENTSVDSGEPGQEIEQFVLTVSNVVDVGQEFLSVDGNAISLTNNGTTNIGSGRSVNVSFAGSTSTVTIASASDFTEAEVEAIVDGLTYENQSADPTAGVRAVTITEIQDEGSNVAPNDNLNDALNVTSNVTVAVVNDPPTVAATANDPTYVEGAAAVDLYNGVTVDVVEAGQLVQSLTLTVSNLQNGADEILVVDGTDVALTNGNNLTTAANGFDVAVSLAGGTAAVTVTRVGDYTAAEAEALIDGLAYRNDNFDFEDGGTRVVTIAAIQDDGGTDNDGDDTETPNVASTVTLASVNSPPTLTADGDDPAFTEGDPAVGLYSNAVVDVVEPNDLVQSIALTVDNLQNGADEILVVDGTNVALTNGNSVTTAANGFDVNVTVAGNTATVVVTKVGNYSQAEAAALVDGLAYENASDDPLGANRLVTLTEFVDDGGAANGGSDTTALNVASTVTLTAVNDAPQVAAAANDPDYVEGAAAVDLYSAVTVTAVEAADAITQLALTVSNLQDGADEILVVDGTDVALTDGNNIVTAANGFFVNVAVVGNEATVTIARPGDFTPAEATALIDGLAYRNDGFDFQNAATRIVTLTEIQDDGGTANGGQNVAALNIASTVTLATVNDPPTLTANGDDPAFTENDPAVGLYSNAVVDVVEAGDLVQTLVLTVDNIQNGADEILVVDGDEVSLTNGNNVVTAANGFTVDVSVAGNTATVTITRVGNFTAAEAETLVDGLEYRNASEDPLGVNRIVTLTSIQDDGGTDNGGDDETALNIVSTVAVTPVNDPPTLIATPQNPNFTEGGASAVLFSGTSVDLVESGDLAQTLVLTVSSLQNGADEILEIDGTDVALTNGNVVLTAANGYTVGVSVAGNVATVTITRAGNFTPLEAETLVDGLAYRNDDDNPLGADRTVTLTYIQDDGGVANGGDDDSVLSVASVVSLSAVNDPPTVTVPGPQNVNEDAVLVLPQILVDDAEAATLELTLSVNDGTLTFTDTTGLTFVEGSNGSAFLRVQGTIAALNNALGMVGSLEYLGDQDFELDDLLTVTVSDLGAAGSGGVLTATDTVFIDVNPVNDPPVAQPVNVTGNEDDVAVFNLDADDVDLNDSPATLDYTLVSGPVLVSSPVALGPVGGTVTVHNDGTFTFDPGTAFQALSEGETATVAFRYLATDSANVDSNVAIVTILVEGRNDAPAIDNVVLATPVVSESGTAVLNGSFSDVDTSNTHRVVVHWGNGASTSTGQGTVNVNQAANTFSASYIYPDDPAGIGGGPFNITITLVDSSFAAVQANEAIVVNNLAPQITQISATDVTPDGEAVLTIRYTDAGVFDSHAVLISWGDGQTTVISLPASGGQGVATASHTFVGNPDPGNPAAPIPINVTLVDDDGGETQASTMAGVAGTGIQTVAIDTTPPIAQLTVPPPPTIEVFVDQPLPPELIQIVEIQIGRTGPAQGGSEQVVLRRILPDGTEDQQIRLDSEDSDPETVLKNLQETFNKLPDDHYRIYLIREDGTERLVLDVYLRDHKQVEADKLQDRKTVPERKPAPPRDEAAPRELQPPAEGKRPDGERQQPDEVDRDERAGDGGTDGVENRNGAAGPELKPPPVRPGPDGGASTTGGRPAATPALVEPEAESPRAAALAGLAVGTGAAGAYVWKRRSEDALAEWGRTERSNRRSRLRNNDSSNRNGRR